MTDAPRLLLVAHGTRSAAGRRTVERLRDGVAGRLPGVDVALSWVDLLEPRPQDVLDDGVTTVVVPCFLAAGYHVRTDVAAAVTAARGVAGRLPASPHSAVVSAVGGRLIRRFGLRSARLFGKAIPGLGGVLGALSDRKQLNRIAEAARKGFPQVR